MFSEPEHPIRVVVRRTGLTSHVIRAWERRYGAVTPHRTDGNRRLYSEADIRRLVLLNRVVQTGRSIGQIAALPEEKLLAYLEEDGNGADTNARGASDYVAAPQSPQPLSTDAGDTPAASAGGGSPTNGRMIESSLPSLTPVSDIPWDSVRAESTVAGVFVPRANGTAKSPEARRRQAEAQELVASCLRAVEQFDATTLEREIERASVRIGRLGVVENVVLPLVELIGQSWHQGRLRMVHEHMAIAVIRTYMGTLINTFRPSPSAPRAVAATPIHQLHELGALAAALSAAAEGWQVTYLGPSIPAEELAKAAELAGSHAVLLSVLLPENDLQLENEILTLRKLLPEDIRIVIGGRVPERFHESVARLNVDVRTDLTDLRLSLRNVAESIR